MHAPATTPATPATPASTASTASTAAVADAPEAAVLRSLAARFGAQAVVDEYGTQAMFGDAVAGTLAAGFASPLLDLGLLTVDGAERVKFLHAQLTNDLEHLADGEARWYGYCSPKGRLMSTFIGWEHAGAVMLTVARPLAEGLRKRLSMYVLRTKAKVQDHSGERVLIGIGGAKAPAALGALGLAVPDPMRVASADGLIAVGLAPVAANDIAAGGAGTAAIGTAIANTDANSITNATADADADAIASAASTAGTVRQSLPRWLLCVPVERIEAVWASLTATLVPVSSSAWRWTEVRSAIPRIVPDTSERFVPQMVNFEVAGGVDFKKGCYPGQEIVARSQYLGKLKRRMFLGHVTGSAPAAGSDVSPEAGGEPVGQVVMAAPSPTGGAALLFESRTEAVGSGTLSVGGQPIRVDALPYAMPA